MAAGKSTSRRPARTAAKPAAAGQRPGGFRRPVETLVLRFEGTELEGLVVETRPVNQATFTAIAELANLDTASVDPVQAALALSKVSAEFAKALISWNLEEVVHSPGCDRDDECDCPAEPVPANTEGLNRQDIVFVHALVNGWMNAVAQRAEQLIRERQAAAQATVDDAALLADLPQQPV